MVFHHIKEIHDQFVIVYRHNLIHIFLDIRKDITARRLYCRSVSNCINRRQRHHPALADGFLHAAGSCRFHSDDPDIRIQQLGKG